LEATYLNDRAARMIQISGFSQMPDRCSIETGDGGKTSSILTDVGKS
jgi:hypothetical protein